MDIYIAGGPFHLFNILNLKLNEYSTQPADLLIMDKFAGAAQYAQQIESQSVFENVILVDHASMQKMKLKYWPWCHAFISGFKMMFPSIDQMKYKSLPIYRKNYDRVFIAGTSPQWASFISYQVYHHHAELFYYDDGLGQRAKQKNPPDRVWRKVNAYLHRRTLESKMIKGRYYYSPERVLNRPFPNLKQINPLDAGQREKDILKHIFGYDPAEDPIADRRILYLYNGMERSTNKKEYAALDKELVRDLQIRYSSCFAVKPHPAVETVFDPSYTYNPGTYPLEISFMFQEIDDMVLISPFSVSIINPNFIFGKEPYVILVYKILGIPTELILNMTQADFDHALDVSLVSGYQNKEKVFVPETREALFSFLDKLIN